MKELIIQLRSMNLFAHSAHNLCARVPFHQDHEFFGGVYPAYGSDYDDVVERIIGLMGEDSLALPAILSGVSAKLQSAPSVGVKQNTMFYQYLLNMEVELCKLIATSISQGMSEGTRQLLGDICNKSEMRQYKIKQRIKG